MQCIEVTIAYQGAGGSKEESYYAWKLLPLLVKPQAFKG
jgi:hypothetical protein